jgi:hypothetical protein
MAKNITNFVPGFSGVTEQYLGVEVMEQPVINPNANGAQSGCQGTTNYGSGKQSFCCNIGKTVNVWFQAPGGDGGGACCCVWSDHAGSGAFIKLNDYKYPANACWVFCIPTGGCCRPTVDGTRGACAMWIDVNNNWCIKVNGGHCGCSCCNFTNTTNLDVCESCYMRAWNDYNNPSNGGKTRTVGDCKPGNVDEYICCKNCHEQDGARKFPFDSDVNMFPSRWGFWGTSCCNGVGANSCGIKGYSYRPGNNVVSGRHYIGTTCYGLNGTGGTSMGQYTCNLWGEMQNYPGICTKGVNHAGAVSEGGNCYCGSYGHGAVLVIQYKEEE